MAQVNVTINGRQFRMACEDGQEGHLMRLAKELDDRIVDLRGKFGEVGDTRLTIMAALTVADELSEAVRKAERLERDLTDARSGGVAADERTRAAQAAVAATLEQAAARIEAMARKLNEVPSASDGDVAIG